MKTKTTYPVSFETNSEEETRKLGIHIATFLPPVAVVVLTGDLGAGKTALAKGIVEGLGVAQAEDVASPTFSLIHEYGDPVRVYHIDLYRLDTAEEASRIGLEELFDQSVLVLIEWGDKFPDLLPLRKIVIRITNGSEDQRFIQIDEQMPLATLL